MKTLISCLLTMCMVLALCCPVCAEEATLYEYEVLEDGTARLTVCNAMCETVRIPAEIDGYAVSVIGDSLFLRNSALRTVVIPDSVRTIEAGAFQETRLEQVFLPEGLQTIERQAFFFCTALNRLVIPSTVTSIGEHAVGFGYYQDPAYPNLVPGMVGVREAFTLIADNNPVAEQYAADSGVACRTVDSFPQGDADFSGTTDSTDARLLLSYVLNNLTRTWRVADLNDSGTADTGDVRLILSALVLQ